MYDTYAIAAVVSAKALSAWMRKVSQLSRYVCTWLRLSCSCCVSEVAERTNAQDMAV